MPLTISELCIQLNKYANFLSPPAGQNPDHAGGAPFLNLAEGTRTLILIADTFHDFKHVDKITEMPDKPKPGSDILKRWAIKIIEKVGGIPDIVDIVDIVNSIYTHPEEFVFMYLYYNDNINVMSSDDMYGDDDVAAAPGDPPPAGTNTNFIIFPFPELSPGCPNGVPFGPKGSHNSKKISKDSAQKLYNFFKDKQKNKEWTLNNALPGYSEKIGTLDTLWWSWDQGSVSKIFGDYDIEPGGGNVTPEIVTNWWQWFGYAAQYDRVEMTDPTKINKLFINKLHPHAQVNPQIILPQGDGILGVNNLTLNADNFVWREVRPGNVVVDTSVSYELEMRSNLKNLLANAIGYLSSSGPLHIGKLFVDIFAILQDVAIMINRLIPDVVKFVLGLPVGIDDTTRNWWDIISIFTDFKRIGDYMQAKELYYVDALKNMSIPLQTHDNILAAISNKIFNNYTVWQKKGIGNRCGIYILMLPFDNVNGQFIPRNTKDKLIMTDGMNVILELLSKGKNVHGVRPEIWGGKKGGMGKGKGKGKGTAVARRDHLFKRPQTKSELEALKHEEFQMPEIGYYDYDYKYFKDKINEIFSKVKPEETLENLREYYKQLEEEQQDEAVNKKMELINVIIDGGQKEQLLNFVLSYATDTDTTGENANWLFNMMTDFFINNYVISAVPLHALHPLDYMLNTNLPAYGYSHHIHAKGGGNIKSKILAKIVKYIEQIKIIKENIKKLNKNKNKNKDIIIIKKKLIEKILIKIKKEREKEKEKIKKEREKEKKDKERKGKKTI